MSFFTGYLQRLVNGRCRAKLGHRRCWWTRGHLGMHEHAWPFGRWVAWRSDGQEEARA